MNLRCMQSLLFWALIAIAGAAFAGSADSMSHHHEDQSIGVPGRASNVNRTVHIDMSDAMRFIPASLTVKQGETIRFQVKNSGRLVHEFVLGTEQDLKNHNEMMEESPEMEHADANMITVAPGQTGEVIWHFTQSGEVNFACLIPGHFDAGMKGEIQVAPENMPDHDPQSHTPAGHNH